MISLSTGSSIGCPSFQVYNLKIISVDQSHKLLAGVDKEFTAGLTTSQDLLASMSNFRTISEETARTYWDLLEANINYFYLNGRLKL